MTVLDGTELFLVPPCMPWYAPWNNDVDSPSTKKVAVVMHYLTSQEVRGYIGYPEWHTSNHISIATKPEHLVSAYWLLPRQTIGDEALFNRCLKMEVTPFAFPHQGKMTDIFALADIQKIMRFYRESIKTAIEEVDWVLLCSKAAKTKVI